MSGPSGPPPHAGVTMATTPNPGPATSPAHPPQPDSHRYSPSSNGYSLDSNRYSIVIPTAGRPSLVRLLETLSRGHGPRPDAVVVVDDRRADLGLPDLALPDLGLPVSVLAGGARGPAAARNVGWRAVTTAWVVFVDDDVVPVGPWMADLAADLDGLAWQVVGSQARLHVPLPGERRPTDWERNVAGLAVAQWATADLAYRLDALAEVGGFDERFPRAFREDADLGLRMAGAGYVVVQGERRIDHPVRPVGRWVSVGLQAGNADDVLMRARHGAGWRLVAGAEPGRNGRHLLTTLAGAVAAGSALTGRWRSAALGGAGWLALTAELAARRIAPGPRTASEIATMAFTSAVIPAAATGHLVRGWAALPGLLRDQSRSPLGQPRSPLALQPARVLTPRRRRARPGRVDVDWKPAAILFDRDGTLVLDVPGNADPERVALMPGARAAVRRARAGGLALGVVTNQAGVGRGSVARADVEAVNRRVDDMVGPFDTWLVCPHAPGDGCRCRKPAPGLVVEAALALGVDAQRCAVIGDVGTDMEAAEAAGARGVLVPTPATRPSEIEAAPVVAADILRAVDLVLAGMC